MSEKRKRKTGIVVGRIRCDGFGSVICFFVFEIRVERGNDNSEEERSQLCG
jgi:hypothetical protein